MTFLPIVAREMMTLSRRKGTYRGRVAAALIAIAVMVYLLILSLSGLSMSKQGQSVFFVLSSLSFGFCLIAGLIATSDCVSEEKREGTLGLLFLTDLKGYDIVLGKLAATSLNTAFCLLAIVPMLATALLLGGVTIREVALTALVLVDAMILSLATGVFISSLFKNERKALLAGTITLLFLVFGPYLLAMAIMDFDRFPEIIVWPSPLYAFLTLQMAPSGWMKGDYFWISLIAQQILAWIFLGFAARILPRCVNELPRLKFAGVQLWFHRMVFGKREVRNKYRGELLDRNPFLWLASRERVKKHYAWTILLFFSALYLWMYSDKSIALDLTITGVILFLTHFIYKLWLASEVCSRLIEDKRSGALELLLSSPLSVREIAHGQRLALRRIFGGPIIALLLAELWVFYETLKWSRGSTPTEVVAFFAVAISSLLLDLWALKWAGLWSSLFGKSIERVMISVIGRVLTAPWIVFIVLLLLAQAIAHSVGSDIKELHVIAAWGLISVSFSLLIGISSKSSFLKHFRAAAAQTFDAKAVSQSGMKTWVEDLLSKFQVKFLQDRKLPTTLRRHPVTFLVMSCIALTIVCVGVRKHYWGNQIARRLDAIRKRGEPVSIADLANYVENVPASENGLMRLERAGVIKWSGVAINLDTAQFRKFNRSVAPEMKAKFSTVISANGEILTALRDLTNYSRGSEVISFPSQSNSLNFYTLRNFLRLELADAFSPKVGEEIDRGRIVADLNAVLSVARLLRQVPEPDWQWTCLNALVTFKDGFEKSLQEVKFDRSELRKFKSQLEMMESGEYLRRTLVTFRAELLSIAKDPSMLGNPAELPLFFNATDWLLGTVGTRDQIMSRSLDAFDEILGMNNQDYAPTFDFGSSNVSSSPLGKYLLFNLYAQKMTSILSEEALTRAHLKILRTAIAVEEYRMDHRGLPRTLNELTPEYLKTVPMDPISTGVPLGYSAALETTNMIISSKGVHGSVSEELTFSF